MDDLDIFEHQYPQVVIVPSVQPSSCACQRQQKQQCRCTCSSSSPVRSPLRTSAAAGCCTSNFLVKGGGRAVDKALEERAARQEAALWKDMKVANHALANELVRLQTHGSKERQSLQEELSKLELLVQVQQEKMDVLQSRLAGALQQHQEAEERHHCKLKELARRLKEEHLSKMKSLQELNSQLMSELSARQQDCTQLAPLRQQLEATSERLDAEAGGRAELWQRCCGLEGELAATSDKLAAATKSLRRAEQQLERASKLDHKLSRAEEALQAEQVTVSKLQADLTLEQSQAAVKRGEVTRLQQEVLGLSQRLHQGDEERAALKLALADAQAAAADAAMEVKAAAARADRLQQELEITRSEAESQATSLRNQAIAREERLGAQSACRLAQLQSELDTQAVATADTEARLAAAKAQVEQLTHQVESLRQLSDAAGGQLVITQGKLDQLKSDKDQHEQQLQAQLQALQLKLMHHEAELSEQAAAADSSSRSWAQDNASLQRAADKWRLKALELQEELEARQEEAMSSSKAHTQEVAKLQVALDTSSAEVAHLHKQLAAVEAERSTAAKRSSTLMTQWEQRDAARDDEVSKLRSQVHELLVSGNEARCDADSLRQAVKANGSEVERLTLALADEQSRLAAVRAQLGALEQERAEELEARLKGMQDMSAGLQAEQQARLEAQLEINRHKKRIANLENELQQQRAAMVQVLDAKSRAEEAAATTAAALSAAERKAKQYRGDSTALLSDYDTWLQGLLAKKSSSGSGGTGSTGGGVPPTAVPARASGMLSLTGNASAAAAAAADAGRAAGLQSPAREGGLSRSTSQLGSPSPLHTGLASPVAAAAAGFATQQSHHDPELERYDRIAALLENRGVSSSSLTRALSGKSPSLSPAASMGRPSTARLSPRPVFK